VPPLGLSEFEADYGFAFAPDGASGCGVRSVLEDEPGKQHFEFAVFREGQEQWGQVNHFRTLVSSTFRDLHRNALTGDH